MRKEIIVQFCDGQKAECEVEYEYHPCYRGAREGRLQLEPDEPEGVEIVSILLGDIEISEWEVVDLSALEQRIIEDTQFE